MASLDTNVLVRYLVEDDRAQFAAAKGLIDKALSTGDTLFVPITVTIELEWVLRSGLQMSKDEVIHALERLLSAVQLSFQSEKATLVAIGLYQGGAADFSDCLHTALAQAASETPLWTFDKAAARLEGARLLA